MSKVGTATGSNEQITTATLKEGKTYVYAFYHKDAGGNMLEGAKPVYYAFERSVPKRIPDDVADELELLTAETPLPGSGGREVVERDIFEIDRDAPAASIPEEMGPKKFRVRLVAVPAKTAAPARATAPATEARPKFGGNLVRRAS